MQEPIALLTQSQLKALVSESAREAGEVALAQKGGSELWTARKVAEYLDTSYGDFCNRLQFDKGFPSPVIVGGTTKQRKRWPSSKIIAWAEGKR